MKKIIITVLFVLVSSTFALASPWTQQFNESGVGHFVEMDMFMLTPGLQFTGSSGYTMPNWMAVDAPLFIQAMGPAATSINWNVGFSDNTPFAIDFFAFDASHHIVDAAIGNWNGGWSFAGIENASAKYASDLRLYAPADNAPVPEPGTLALLAIGITGMIVIIKRRQNSLSGLNPA